MESRKRKRCRTVRCFFWILGAWLPINLGVGTFKHGCLYVFFHTLFADYKLPQLSTHQRLEGSRGSRILVQSKGPAQWPPGPGSWRWWAPGSAAGCLWPPDASPGAQGPRGRPPDENPETPKPLKKRRVCLEIEVICSFDFAQISN